MNYTCTFKLPTGDKLLIENIKGPKLRQKLSQLLKENYYWTKQMSSTMFHNLKKKLQDPTSKRGIHPLLLSVIQYQRQ